MLTIGNLNAFIIMASGTECWKATFPLLVKLGVMASIASVLARSNSFKSLLMRETRTLNQRVALALWLASVFGVSVAIRVVSKSYQAADLGLEGSLIAGILGGYVTGLLSGVLISLPAMLNPSGGEHLTMPLLAGRRRAGRPAARPGARPRRHLALLPVLRPQHLPLLQGKPQSPAHGVPPGFFAGILCAEFLRQTARSGWQAIFSMHRPAATCPPSTCGRHLRHHAVRRRHPAEDLEQHAQREETRGAGAPAGGSAPGRPHQPDQSAFPVQYAELGLLADPHRSQPGAGHGGETFQSAAPPAAQTRELQPAARRIEFH